jgi:hypothetical protein
LNWFGGSPLEILQGYGFVEVYRANSEAIGDLLGALLVNEGIPICSSIDQRCDSNPESIFA